jgi:hypothetical protein
MCLDPYPGRLQDASTRFFSQSIGLPRGNTGSALRHFPNSYFSGSVLFGVAVIY